MTFVKFDACVIKNRCLWNAEMLRDETACCPVLVVSALLVLIAGGSRAAKLSEFFGRKYAVY